MKRWCRDNPLVAVGLAIWLLFFIYCKYQYSQKPASKGTVADHIRHADTYYWFNLTDGDANAALSSAEKEIKKALAKLNQSDLSEKEKKRLKTRISGIKDDIHYQHTLHLDRFHGIFTWSHFLAKPSLFHDDKATGSYGILPEQPEVIACQEAVKNLCERVLGAQTVVAQHDVVFVTDPADFPRRARGRRTR